MHNKSCASYFCTVCLKLKILLLNKNAGALGYQLQCFVLHHTYIRTGDL